MEESSFHDKTAWVCHLLLVIFFLQVFFFFKLNKFSPQRHWITLYHNSDKLLSVIQQYPLAKAQCQPYTNNNKFLKLIRLLWRQIYWKYFISFWNLIVCVECLCDLIAQHVYMHEKCISISGSVLCCWIDRGKIQTATSNSPSNFF